MKNIKNKENARYALQKFIWTKISPKVLWMESSSFSVGSHWTTSQNKYFNESDVNGNEPPNGGDHEDALHVFQVEGSPWSPFHLRQTIAATNTITANFL